MSKIGTVWCFISEWYCSTLPGYLIISKYFAHPYFAINIFFYWLYIYTQLKSLQGSLKFSKKYYTKCKQSILKMKCSHYMNPLWYKERGHFPTCWNPQNKNIDIQKDFYETLSPLVYLLPGMVWNQCHNKLYKSRAVQNY